MGLIKSLSIHPYRKNVWKEWLERMIDSEIFVNPQQTSFSLLQSVPILSSQNANSTRREVMFHSTPVLIQNNDLKLHRQWTVLALRTHLHPALWVRLASHLIFDLHHCGQVAIIIMMSLLVSLCQHSPIILVPRPPLFSAIEQDIASLRCSLFLKYFRRPIQKANWV